MSDTRLNPRGEDPVAPLPDRLSTVLSDPVDERAVARMWRRIEERRRPTTRVGMILGWASAGAALAVLVIGLFAVVTGHVGGDRASRPSPPVALVLEDGRAVAPLEIPAGAKPGRIDLADGSSIMLESGGAIEPLASSGREFIVRLGRGRATFRVEPGGPRRWIVEAGIASVEVVGTQFTVTRRDDSVRVDVVHGTVLVRGATVPEGVARLSAGASIEVVARPTVAEDATSPGKPAAAAPRSGGWRERARRGEYAVAYRELGSEGVARETAQARSAEELFTLADVARLSGHPADALPPLEGLLVTYPGSPRASLAALTLGRLHLDLGQASRAARALERTLALGAPSGLEEDVFVRLVEAYVRSGDRARARSSADEYARRFPDGRRRADVARWLER